MLPVFEKRELVTGWRHPWVVYQKQSVLVAYCSSWHSSETADIVCHSSGRVLLLNGLSILRRRRLLLRQGSILYWTGRCSF
jgi:hypothetical protein